MVCEKCGWEMRVGDWPFCGNGRDHQAAVANIATDDIPGGQVIETLGPEPMTFYSKKAILAEADRRGLRPTDRWAGPGDKHWSNWRAAIDAQTLANAAALLARRQASDDPDAQCKTFRGEIRKWEGQ